MQVAGVMVILVVAAPSVAVCCYQDYVLLGYSVDEGCLGEDVVE